MIDWAFIHSGLSWFLNDIPTRYDAIILASSDQTIHEYDRFPDVLAALGTLVVFSMCLERALAFIFEHEWFLRLTTIQQADDSDPPKMMTVSLYPGLKGLIAIVCSCVICATYDFDIISTLFGKAAKSDSPWLTLGELITSLVAAGGSAGAISLFQGFLNISKESRDALIAARKAEAEEAAAIAKSNKVRVEAEAATQVAEAKVKQLESEKKLLVANAEKLEAEAKLDNESKKSGTGNK